MLYFSSNIGIQSPSSAWQMQSLEKNITKRPILFILLSIRFAKKYRKKLLSEMEKIGMRVSCGGFTHRTGEMLRLACIQSHPRLWHQSSSNKLPSMQVYRSLDRPNQALGHPIHIESRPNDWRLRL